MNRYLLRKPGADATPEELASLVTNPRISVVDGDMRTRLMIETSRDALLEIKQALPDWSIDLAKMVPGATRLHEKILGFRGATTGGL
ncbi:hypothetical protein [Shimia abyssi]|uniref:Uncharacterized protein n=1 Tax=Shimia abyssi TaxID=1662395 RepID=A0A2P8FBN3_9RHOB|nr:hypothetical protein [Shimia abyssi]PSL19135.1 hypothetical protein CLV88_10778 [Shimia abyssi]